MHTLKYEHITMQFSVYFSFGGKNNNSSRRAFLSYNPSDVILQLNKLHSYGKQCGWGRSAVS